MLDRFLGWSKLYGNALSESRFQLGFTVLAALALAAWGAWMLDRPARVERLARLTRRKTFIVGLFLVAAGLLLVRAWQLLWIGDDAFISFRYVDNFVSGHGLVFNPGERVEGYTNFLWVMVLSAFAALGLPIPETSVVLNLLFTGLHVLVMILLLWEHDPLVRMGKPFLPITPFLVGFNHAFLSFSTSGLETALGACLVTTGFYFALKPVGFRNGLLAGLALILGTMTRPDYSLFYIAMAAAIAYDAWRTAPGEPKGALHRFLSPEMRRAALGYVLPFFLLYLPYFIWRWNYYGYFYPNTYYAKMAYDSYWSQGVLYLVAFLFGDNFWIAGLWWAGALWLSRRRAELRRLNAFAVLASALVAIYTMKVGGDFMYGRFFAPLAPLVLLSLETSLKAAFTDKAFEWPKNFVSMSKRAFFAIGLSAFLAGWLVLPFKLISPGNVENYISDESSFYHLYRFHHPIIENNLFFLSHEIKKAFADFEEKPVIASNATGMITYYSKQSVIDFHGLTDEHIAHQPYEAPRGRPGHERKADWDYLRKRNTYIIYTYADASPYPGYENLTGIYFSNMKINTVTYRADILKRLSKNERIKFRYTDFPGYLDRYILEMPDKSIEDIEKDLIFMKDFYFEHNPDPARLQAIQSHLTQRRVKLFFKSEAP